MTINNKEWLTPDELAQEYGFSKSTQNQYRMARKIPYHKVSRFIRYKKSEIDKWLDDNKVEVA
ncbi:MAG TPA: DNA-binding protein [Sulfurimonas sp.]|nr:DNA-binding protein [Sulfurimonas sp.]